MMDLSPALPRAALSRTMTVLLAGADSSRLHELTARMCKPALPLFATHKGPLRIVDFAMANAVRSGLPRMIAATQCHAETLEAHLERRWAPLFPGAELLIRNGSAVRGAGGYRGSADAVAANLALIDAAAPDEVLVLPGDQIYQMDYSALIAAHRESGAMVTLAVHRLPVDQARDYQVVPAAPGGKIIDHDDRFSRPAEDPDQAGQAVVSMGVLVFDWAWLRNMVTTSGAKLDFGRDILPVAVAAGLAMAYPLPALPGQPAPYWRDVGTLDSLRQTLLEFSNGVPCHVPVLPGAPFRLAGMQPDMVGSLAAEGLSRTQSAALPGAWIMPGARLERAIIAPGTSVPADLEVGVDAAEDARWFRRTEAGTVLVTNAMLARRAGRAFGGLRGPLLRAFDLPSIAC